MKQSVVKLIKRFYGDDDGMVQASSYILLVVLVGVGMVAGLGTFRDQVVQEFGDIAESVESLDQSYSYTITGPNNVVIKTVVFDEDNPPVPVAGPAFPAATFEGPGGTPPGSLGFPAATNEAN